MGGGTEQKEKKRERTHRYKQQCGDCEGEKKGWRPRGHGGQAVMEKNTIKNELLKINK